METKFDFPNWIEKETQARGWTIAELARQADVHSSTISMVLSGLRNPGPDLCNGLARAFRIPAEEVFRRAELLPSRSTGAELQEFVEIVSLLEAADIAVLARVARGMLNEERRG